MLIVVGYSSDALARHLGDKQRLFFWAGEMFPDADFFPAVTYVALCPFHCVFVSRAIILVVLAAVSCIGDKVIVVADFAKSFYIIGLCFHGSFLLNYFEVHSCFGINVFCGEQVT